MRITYWTNNRSSKAIALGLHYYPKSLYNRYTMGTTVPWILQLRVQLHRYQLTISLKGRRP